LLDVVARRASGCLSRGASVSPLLFALCALAAFGLSIPAFRGFRDIHEALWSGELQRLSAPLHWQAVRVFGGLLAALPVYMATRSLGAGALGAALAVAALGYAVAPHFLVAMRRRAEQALVDELALHLELMALVTECGGSLTAALGACVERAPDGPLRRAWKDTLVEICGGAELDEVLRSLDQRVGVRPISTLVMALRSAERAGAGLPLLLRERARQAAAGRFARAERLARAAPLKLWATLMLCLAPCTLLVLAFPLADLMAVLLDR
jgi:tight adherence protein C